MLKDEKEKAEYFNVDDSATFINVDKVFVRFLVSLKDPEWAMSNTYLEIFIEKIFTHISAMYQRISQINTVLLNPETQNK